jgi:hypothetical protein
MIARFRPNLLAAQSAVRSQDKRAARAASQTWNLPQAPLCQAVDTIVSASHLVNLHNTQPMSAASPCWLIKLVPHGEARDIVQCGLAQHQLQPFNSRTATSVPIMVHQRTVPSVWHSSSRHIHMHRAVKAHSTVTPGAAGSYLSLPGSGINPC